MRLPALTKKELAKSTKKGLPSLACVLCCGGDLASELVQEWPLITDIIRPSHTSWPIMALWAGPPGPPPWDPAYSGLVRHSEATHSCHMILACMVCEFSTVLILISIQNRPTINARCGMCTHGWILGD